MSPQEINDTLVRIAREMDALGDLCDFVDYDPKIGRVPEHFEPKWMIADLVRRLLAERMDAAQRAGESARLELLGIAAEMRAASARHSDRHSEHGPQSDPQPSPPPDPALDAWASRLEHLATAGALAQEGQS